jgi:hypothetical protein
MATVANIRFRRGEDLILTFSAAVVPVGGVTGWTTRFTMRPKKDITSTPVIEIDGSIVDEPTGVFQVVVPRLSTQITPSTYYYDFWRTNSGANASLSVGEAIVDWAVRP